MIGRFTTFVNNHFQRLTSLEGHALTLLSRWWSYGACLVIVYVKHINDQSFTGWDTFDYLFPKFLYMADSVWSGHYPWWNPFQNAGDYFATPGLQATNPIFAPFWFLSRIMHPMLAFELSNMAIVTLATFALRRFLRVAFGPKGAVNEWGLMAASTILSTMVVWPFLGQISFIYSTAVLFFLLWFVFRTANGETPLPKMTIFVLGLAIGLLAGAGYIFLNACNGLILASVALAQLVRSRTRSAILGRWILFLIPFTIVSFAMAWPIFENSKEYYRWFAGDLDSPDGRVRFFPPKTTDLTFHFDRFWQAIVATFDVNLVQPRTTEWIIGAGIGLLGALLSTWRNVGAATESLRVFVWRHIGWLVGAGFFWLMALGSATAFYRDVIQNIPVFNNNRFPVITVIESQLCFLVFFYAYTTSSFWQNSWSTKRWHRSLYAAAITCAGWLFTTSPLWIAVGLLVFVLDEIKSRTRSSTKRNAQLMLAVIVGTLFSRYQWKWDLGNVIPKEPVWSQVSSRPLAIRYIGNDRMLPMPEALKDNTDYPDYGDYRWVTERRPFTRGYNLFNHPLQAKLKTSPVWNQILSVATTTRYTPWPDRRNFKSDNALLDDIANQIEDGATDQTLLVHDQALASKLDSRKTDAAMKDRRLSTIESVVTEPNTVMATIERSTDAFVVFHSKAFPGWSAWIDGHPAELIPANFIMSAVIVPAGRHQLRLEFEPKAKWILLIPHFAAAIIVLFLAMRALMTMPTRGSTKAKRNP